MAMSRQRKANEALFPEWLQILRPKRDDGESTDRELSMTGRVKNHVSAEASALAEQVIGVSETTAQDDRLKPPARRPTLCSCFPGP